MLRFLPAAIVLVAACQPATASRPTAAAAATMCVVADMGTADPELYQHVTAEMAQGREAWSLWSATDGLVTYDEYYDVLRTTADAGTFSYKRVKFGEQQAASAKDLDAAALSAFTTKMAGADRLCDFTVPSFDGTTHHYLHVAKQDDGTLKTFGAFLAVSPDAAAAGAAHAAITQAFAALQNP